MASKKCSAATTIHEATISCLAAALDAGHTTAVDLVAKHLLRIATYDTRNTNLNSIPLLNPNVFAEAAASDHRRASGNPLGPLDGIPFTVKDSYKVAGMTVASGSEAFSSLLATSDAFTVHALRSTGAILIGKTNMCPMAYGGMLRGVYGRAESPYNQKYLAAAFASGSSNGSGVSTAASFSVFGMGEETVSSGRSPASNNGLVAYTPSRGLISIRGNWPLYVTCDVVVPHTRCMDDLLVILEVLMKEDGNSVGDFWRDQPFMKLPRLPQRPSSFMDMKEDDFLQGKKIAVPAMYTGGEDSSTYTSKEVQTLWSKARADFETLGATVEIVKDFPIMRLYEDPASSWPEGYPEDGKLPSDWNTTERGTLIAHAWDAFLRINGDTNFRTLAAADWKKIFPQMSPDDPQVMFSEVANAVHWSKLASYAAENETCTEPGKSKMYDIPNLGKAVKALEIMRKRLFEDWMTTHGFDFVAFPAAGDIGYAEADIDIELARHTWKNGVKYSNGNRCLRHLGIPSITLPMGMIPEKGMPMGMTILGRAYDDVNILRAGFAFEQSRETRLPPPLTPALESDILDSKIVCTKSARLQLHVTIYSVRFTSRESCRVDLEGKIDFLDPRTPNTSAPVLEVYIDGKEVPATRSNLRRVDDTDVFRFNIEATVPASPEQTQRNAVVGKIARDSIMVVVLARDGSNGRPDGWLGLAHLSDIEKCS